MSKEYLAALHTIDKAFRYATNDDNGYSIEPYKVLDVCNNEFDIIESALQRLELIDNAKSSEAFECLKKVNNYLNDAYDYKEIKEEVRNDIETIKQALIKAQEQEKENVELKKVLSIIKEKDVNIWYLTVSTKVKNYKDYNSFLMNDKNKRQLMEEEFELLKKKLG